MPFNQQTTTEIMKTMPAAKAVVDVFGYHLLPRPEGWDQAAALAAAAQAAAHEPEPSLPTDPPLAADLDKWLAKVVSTRTNWAARAALAADVAQDAQLAQLRVARAAAPGLADTIRKTFAATVAQFTALAATAPRGVGGYESDEMLTEYRDLLKVTGVLGHLVMQRSSIAACLQELEAPGDGPWLVLRPADHTTAEEAHDIAAALNRGDLIASVDGWERIINAGADLARIGEATTRRARSNDEWHTRQMATMGAGLAAAPPGDIAYL